MQILVCVFLAGILGSTHAQFDIPDLTGTRVPSGMQINEVMRKSCNDNGGPTAYNTFLQGVSEVKNCFDKVMNETTAAAQRDNFERMDTYLNLLCTKSSTVKSCARKFADTMKVCVKSGTPHDDVDTFYKMATRFMDFACNNTKKIADAFTPAAPGTEPCFASMQNSLVGCIQNMNPSENAILLNPNMPKLSFSTDEEGCRQLDTFEKCTVKALNGCENKQSAELLDSIWKTVNNEIPRCGNLEKSHASSASVVNVALLIAAIAMTL